MSVLLRGASLQQSTTPPLHRTAKKRTRVVFRHLEAPRRQRRREPVARRAQPRVDNAAGARLRGDERREVLQGEVAGREGGGEERGVGRGRDGRGRPAAVTSGATYTVAHIAAPHSRLSPFSSPLLLASSTSSSPPAAPRRHLWRTCSAMLGRLKLLRMTAGARSPRHSIISASTRGVAVACLLRAEGVYAAMQLWRGGCKRVLTMTCKTQRGKIGACIYSAVQAVRTVSAAIGTPGKSARSERSSRYAGRKSWPQPLMQCASCDVIWQSSEPGRGPEEAAKV